MNLNKNYPVLDFVTKCFRKLHIEKYVANLFVNIYSIKNTKIYFDGAGAEKFLNEISSNPNNSCICQNAISPNPEYDLQIIVPVYNVEKYIAECIDSILNQQTKYKFFVIVVNDGSTDNSRKILKKYEIDPRIKIIDQENMGFSGARNSALANVNARYVMFVDSDDRIAEGAIENLVSAADNLSADIVEGGHYYFENEKIISTNIKEESYSIKNLYGFAWGKVFKAELFMHVHFPEKFWFEDTVLFLVLFFMAEKVATIPDIGYWYRRNNMGISATSQKNLKSIDSYWITKRMLQDGEDLHLSASSDLYEALLYQAVINFKRISTIENIEIDMAVFVATRYLLAQYFNSEKNPDCITTWKYSTAEKKYKNLEKAIRHNNFYEYVATCYFM